VPACERSHAQTQFSLALRASFVRKHYVPEVTEIREADPDEAEKEGLKAFNKLENMLSN